jgi:ABC-type transport system substrate-binding protein
VKVIIKHIFFGLLISSFLFLSCKKDMKTEERKIEKHPKYGGVIHLLLESPLTLDPAYLDDVYESEVVNQIFEGLLICDLNMNIKPGLAEYWEISPDKLTYTFYLRKGVRFHNGRDVTSLDVIESFLRLNNSNGSPIRWDHFFSNLKGVSGSYHKLKEVEGLCAVDRYTIKIILTNPVPILLDLLASENYFIVPVDEVNKVGEEQFAHNPIGCGPFKFHNWEKEKRIILLANENYYQGRPFLDSVVFYTQKHYRVESVNEFLNQQIDVSELSSQQAKEFSNKFNIISRPEISVVGLGLNTKKFPFNNLKVRQAVYMAIRSNTSKEIDVNANIPAKSILPTFMSKYTDAQEFRKSNLERAKQLLREAGYDGGKGIGPIELWTSTGRSTEEIIQDLDKLGLKVVQKVVEWPLFVQSLNEHKSSMFTFTWVADYADPHAFYCNLLSSEGSDNYFNFVDKVTDSLISMLHHTKDFIALKELNKKIETIASDLVPFVPLYHPVNNYVMQSNVMDFNVNSFGLSSVKLKYVWINK